MKTKLVLACALVGVGMSQASFATQNRVGAMGGEISMVTDDDTNIDLFPQTINNFNMLRFSNVHTATPDYAIITGDKGKKWGLYGGSTEATREDFLNIYRSMGNDAGLKLGVNLGRHSQTVADDDKVAGGNTSNETKTTYNSIAFDAIYGKNSGKKEMAFRASFAMTPYGAFTQTDTTGTTAGAANPASSTENGFMRVNLGMDLRESRNIAIFNKMYAKADFGYLSSSSKSTTGTTVNSDTSGSTITVSGEALLFNEKKVSENTMLLFGVGTDVTIQRASTANKTPKFDNTTTTLTIGGPKLRAGLETDIKYGKVRFGLQRDLNILSYSSSEDKDPAGTASPANQTDKSLDIISNGGSYTYQAGYGFDYKNLKIDIALANTFWVKGPQMIFDGTTNLGTSASIAYMF